MKIKLDDKYMLTSDSYNFIISQYSYREKDGKQELKLSKSRYVNTLEKALDLYLDICVKELDVDSLKDLKTEIIKLREHTKELISTIKGE